MIGVVVMMHRRAVGVWQGWELDTLLSGSGVSGVIKRRCVCTCAGRGSRSRPSMPPRCRSIIAHSVTIDWADCVLHGTQILFASGRKLHDLLIDAGNSVSAPARFCRSDPATALDIMAGSRSYRFRLFDLANIFSHLDASATNLRVDTISSSLRFRRAK